MLEKGETWSKVVFNGITGYSMNEFLIFADEEPEEPQEPITTATVNADSLWLREYGSSTAPTKAKMSRGDKVDVLEKGETWSKVIFNGMTGYSMNEFLIFADEEPEGPEGARGTAGAYHYRDSQCRFPVAARVWFLHRAYQGKVVPRRQGGCAGEGRDLVQGLLPRPGWLLHDGIPRFLNLHRIWAAHRPPPENGKQSPSHAAQRFICVARLFAFFTVFKGNYS